MYANDASVVTSTTRGLRCEDTLCDRVIHAGDGDEVTTLVKPKSQGRKHAVDDVNTQPRSGANLGRASG